MKARLVSVIVVVALVALFIVQVAEASSIRGG
jgi:hypothetical protein